MAQVGFLPPDDPRVRGTIAAIERDLIVDGLVLRYSTETGVDALPAGEGAFLPCSFWLADCYALTGRRAGERGAVRAPARFAQRRGLARRGVRSPQQAHARQFSAGHDAYGARQYRAIAVDAGGTTQSRRRGKASGPPPRVSRPLLRPVPPTSKARVELRGVPIQRVPFRRARDFVRLWFAAIERSRQSNRVSTR
jgi:hypothetical protein